EVYIALGTTIKVAGSESAFRAVDLNAVLAVARAARVGGATCLGVVSAMGANARSSVFYNRIKGEMEDAVSALGYGCVVLVRPSFIQGDRAALQQPGRTGEGLALVAMRLLRPLIPANYRAVQACDVARALVRAVQQAQPGKRVLLSGDLQTAAG
ncbi:MAG: epimerase, partial [Betaproteobacteria bacterium]